MQSLGIFGAIGAVTLLVAGGAFAQASAFNGQAKLVTAVSAPSKTVVNGVTWSCAGDSCVGSAERYASLDNPVRECKRVAAALGPLAAYSARGREVTGGSLKVCNAEATKPAVVAAAK